MRTGTLDKATPLNFDLNVLDNLVLDYLRGDCKELLSCKLVRGCIEQGHANEALERLKNALPEEKVDQRLLFYMQKQKFLEHISNKAEDRDREAIACARDELAPLALDAYPEAYCEFKQLLLQLITREEKASTSEQDDYFSTQRAEAAAKVFHTTRHLLGCYDPLLLLIFKYLLYLHALQRKHVKTDLPEQDLVDKLLVGQRDEPSLPSSEERSTFVEAQVQAIMQCSGASRQATMESLKYTKGSAFDAFKHELCRIQISEALFRELVEEYARYRQLPAEDGLLSSSVGTSEGFVSEAFQLERFTTSTSESSLATLKAGEGQRSNGANGLKDIGNGLHLISSTSEPLLSASERGLACVRDNTSASRERTMSQSPPYKVARVSGSSSAVVDGRNDGEKQLNFVKWTQQLHELAEESNVEAIISSIKALDPEFFASHPTHLFNLTRLQYILALRQGQDMQALELARNVLTPLSKSDPSLMPLFKSAMSVLLGGDPGDLDSDLKSAVRSTLTSLNPRHAPPPPRLLRLLEALMRMYQSWLEHERFKDPFAKDMKLDALLVNDSPGTKKKLSVTFALEDRNQPEVAPPVDVGGSEEAQAADVGRDVMMDEDFILQLSEILDIPRSESIELLVQHDFDLEAALAQFIS